MKKQRFQPTEIRAYSFAEVINNVQQKAKEDAEKFKQNGGMCLHCGKDKGDPKGFNPYHCKSCNQETQKILDKLSGTKGFMGFTV